MNFEFDFESAAKRLEGIARRTPLEHNALLSKRYACQVYLKREDRQQVRSYKIRGAYNLMSQLSAEELGRGVVCASAGNHAQGVALSCQKLQATGVIFMPSITPKQKVRQTELFGAGQVQVILVGDTFDDCLAEALKHAAEHGLTFVPPFDHPRIIEGQGTVGVEILADLPEVDVVIAPIGGGGLVAGLGSYLKAQRPNIRLLGAEPEGAASMTQALAQGRPVTLEHIDRFVDGAAVRRVGELPFTIAREILDEVFSVPEGLVCKSILDLYNDEALVVEPAGALSVAALDAASAEGALAGKNVVCVISGGNNDIDRMQEIKERALLYLGLKHYFLVRFPQRPGALRHFVNNVLGPNDDITRFEFIKKSERESGPALVGIELKTRDDYEPLLHRMRAAQFDFREVNKEDLLFEYFI